ncbi:Tyrosinase [Dactylellina cionopaga]|nr:Tyrosinase [Dactylellina cionopaga]
MGTFQRLVKSKNDKDDLDTPLYPFKHPDGSWWTSNDVAKARGIWNYGYGYPEVPCERNTDTDTELDKFSTSQINSLYDPAISPSIVFSPAPSATRVQASPGRPSVTVIAGSTIKAGSTTKKSKPTATKEVSADPTVKVPKKSKGVTQWTANVVVDQSELVGTFAIYIFLGIPPTDPAEWRISDKKVGTLTVLGNPGKRMMSKVVTSTVSLTKTLIDKGITGSDSDIDAYLKENLTWKCLNGKEEVDVTTLTSLKVGVTSNNVVPPSDDTKKPTFGVPTLRTSVTEEKDAGVTQPEDLTSPQDKKGEQQTVLNALPTVLAAPDTN